MSFVINQSTKTQSGAYRTQGIRFNDHINDMHITQTQTHTSIFLSTFLLFSTNQIEFINHTSNVYISVDYVTVGLLQYSLNKQ